MSFFSIEAEDSPVQVWKIISSLFDKFDDVSAYYLENKIFDLEPVDFERVELYLSELKNLNEKLNSCDKGYKKTGTTLIILVECKMPACFDMFIQTRNRDLELSRSTTKQTFDDFCKGLINEQERLIVSGQLTPNKALTALNKNHKNFFNNAKGSNPSNTNSGHASHASNENSKQF